jgi:hypothetical protein
MMAASALFFTSMMAFHAAFFGDDPHLMFFRGMAIHTVNFEKIRMEFVRKVYVHFSEGKLFGHTKAIMAKDRAVLSDAAKHLRLSGKRRESGRFDHLDDKIGLIPDSLQQFIRVVNVMGGETILDKIKIVFGIFKENSGFFEIFVLFRSGTPDKVSGKPQCRFDLSDKTLSLSYPVIQHEIIPFSVAFHAARPFPFPHLAFLKQALSFYNSCFSVASVARHLCGKHPTGSVGDSSAAGTHIKLFLRRVQLLVTIFAFDLKGLDETDITMFDSVMTVKAIDSSSCDMNLVDQVRIFSHLHSFHMAGVTILQGDIPCSGGDIDMTLIASDSDLEIRFMAEVETFMFHDLSGYSMTGGAASDGLPFGGSAEMTEVADPLRHRDVLSLNDL